MSLRFGNILLFIRTYAALVYLSLFIRFQKKRVIKLKNSFRDVKISHFWFKSTFAFRYKNLLHKIILQIISEVSMTNVSAKEPCTNRGMTYRISKEAVIEHHDVSLPSLGIELCKLQCRLEDVDGIVFDVLQADHFQKFLHFF